MGVFKKLFGTKYMTDEMCEYIRTGNLEILDHFMRDGININITNKNGDTPLIIAAARGHYELTSLLIKKGADVNSKDNRGETALMQTCILNHPEVAKLLLENGADVTLETKNGYTALTLALDHNSPEIVVFLLNQGALVKADDRVELSKLMVWTAGYFDSCDTVKLFIDKGTDVNAIGEFHLTALMCAAKSGNIQMVKFLLEKGADINMQTAGGSTALSATLSALFAALKYKRTDTFQIGGKISNHSDYTNRLYEAICFLVNNGADVNAKDVDGKSPLVFASEEQQYFKAIMASADTLSAITKVIDVLSHKKKEDLLWRDKEQDFWEQRRIAVDESYRRAVQHARNQQWYDAFACLREIYKFGADHEGAKRLLQHAFCPRCRMLVLPKCSLVLHFEEVRNGKCPVCHGRLVLVR